MNYSHEELRQARCEVNTNAARTVQKLWLPELMDNIDKADQLVKEARDHLAELRDDATALRKQRNSFIRHAIKNGAGVHELARELGLSPSMVCDINAGRR